MPSENKVTLRTSSDAFEFCQALVESQLQEAELNRVEPNVATKGDTIARSSILLLLSDPQRRNLFLHMANNRKMWPRIRPLFGAPPYNFLMPNDAWALRAGGFAKSRLNMTYDNSRAANVSQFGAGQYEDQHGRSYRIVASKFEETAPLGSEFLDTATQIVLQVKVKKRGRAQKHDLLNSINKSQLFFPKPGESIVLRESKALVSAIGRSEQSETVLKVKACYPRDAGASTATVLIAR
jgi:hypothetical protein